MTLDFILDGFILIVGVMASFFALWVIGSEIANRGK
jgi:hypothetical protein